MYPIATENTRIAAVTTSSESCTFHTHFEPFEYGTSVSPSTINKSAQVGEKHIGEAVSEEEGQHGGLTGQTDQICQRRDDGHDEKGFGGRPADKELDDQHEEVDQKRRNVR